MPPTIETSALKNLHLCGVMSSLSLDISPLNLVSYLIGKPFSAVLMDIHLLLPYNNINFIFT